MSSSSSSTVGTLSNSSGFVGCCRCFSTSAKSRRRHVRRPTGKIYGDVSRSWTSRKSLRMPLKDWKKDETEAKSFASYVSDGSRILSLTFPDENRRTRIDENTWKVELLPFDFLGNKVVVRTTIALIPNRTDKSISINAKKLEFEGMPKEFNLDETVTLKMEGKLGEERSFRKRRRNDSDEEVGGDEEEEEHGEDDKNDDMKRAVRGDVVMTLDASVNDFVALVPGLDDVVNAINDAVLANLQGAIEKNLIAEYERWRNEEVTGEEEVKEDERKREKTLYRGNGAPVGVVPKRVARF
ncbi:unnamed protein product [Bathycoccus prasinos]